jgi:iron complex outermembrane receptor protein
VRTTWSETLGILALVAGMAFTAPAAASAQAGRIEGSVHDAAGQPVAGAQVLVDGRLRAGSTGADGGFVVQEVQPGARRLRVLAMGYAPAERTVTVAAGAAGEPVRIRLEHTPLTLPGIQVTASPTAGEVGAVAQATSQLAGRALEREMGGTLAHTLRAQPGVAMRSMGPAATMPVLRGLTGDRVLVLHDGQRTGDLAGSADDHGVTVDPLAAQRVEVVRGPATLLYGNNALGGVVNVISDDVPAHVPGRAEWSAGVHSESAYPGGAASLKVTAPLGGAWAGSLRLGGRSTGDVRIPADAVLGSRLRNTDMESWNGALGIGRAGERLEGGVVARAYRFGYGLPVPPGASPVSLRGRRWELRAGGELRTSSPLAARVRADAAAQDYAHDEIDDARDHTLQRFALRTRTAGVRVHQRPGGRLLDGAWGLSGLWKAYSATGPEALTPPADSRGLGVFGFQELRLVGGASLQLGGRYDDYRIASTASDKFGAGRARAFRAVSGSAGLRVPLADGWSAAVSTARSFRAPTVEELFSAAAHAGTGAVELGNPTLRAEHGFSVEGVLRAQTPRWTGQVAAYRNRVDDYVYLATRGDTVLYGVRLPVLEYAQGAAVLRGVEGQVEVVAARSLVVGMMGDWLHAEHADGTPLSFMPPPRLGGTVRWDDGRWMLGADLHHEMRQDRVGAAAELPTPAHTTVRLTAGVRVPWAGSLHSITLRAENLTNEMHREATSRIKDFAPGPGRNLSLLYRVMF